MVSFGEPLIYAFILMIMRQKSKGYQCQYTNLLIIPIS